MTAPRKPAAKSSPRKATTTKADADAGTPAAPPVEEQPVANVDGDSSASLTAAIINAGGITPPEPAAPA
jgi:hypothetical protein